MPLCQKVGKREEDNNKLGLEKGRMGHAHQLMHLWNSRIFFRLKRGNGKFENRKEVQE